jgi:hypothetical protein
MARILHGIEKGIRLHGENSDSLNVDIIFGTSAPGGDSGEQDAAALGSLYLRQNGGSSSLYQKVDTTNTVADWQLNGNSSVVIGTWRPETVRVVTNDTQGAGTRDMTASPFSDDEGTLITAASFTVGDHIISDADGTPALLRVSAISSPNVTFVAATTPLATDDTFIAVNYLPDTPAGQEGRAIVNYNGTVMVKLGDIDWNFADGINIAAGYTPGNGTVSSSDTVQSAIQKLDGNQIDLITLSGVAQGAVDLGTFTGTTIPDSSTVKDALQALETAVEGGGQFSANAVTAATTLDSVLVDNYAAVKWYLYARDTANPARSKAFEIYAVHNGTPSADATQSDDTVYSKLKIGANFNITVAIDLNGSGASQSMRLRISSSEAGGVDVRVRREAVSF